MANIEFWCTQDDEHNRTLTPQEIATIISNPQTNIPSQFHDEDEFGSDDFDIAVEIIVNGRTVYMLLIKDGELVEVYPAAIAKYAIRSNVSESDIDTHNNYVRIIEEILKWYEVGDEDGKKHNWLAIFTEIQRAIGSIQESRSIEEIAKLISEDEGFHDKDEFSGELSYQDLINILIALPQEKRNQLAYIGFVNNDGTIAYGTVNNIWGIITDKDGTIYLERG